MKYTYSQMKRKYTKEQLETALTEWIKNSGLRVKLVVYLSRDGNEYKGHQMQYKGMEMIITGQAYLI